MTVDGPGLRDIIESCYFAFRRRVRDISQATMCECNACVRIPRLNLKLVAHHGAVAWTAEQERARTKVTGHDALFVVAMQAPVPREVLWEWTTSPALRTRWTTGLSEVQEESVSGRRGVGTVNHCAHGENLSIEEVVDWVPPEYETKRITMVGTGLPPTTTTMELIARGPDRTDLVWRMARPGSARDERTLSAMEDQLRSVLMHDGGVLMELAAADAQAIAADGAAGPDVPTSAARYLSEPLTATDPEGDVD